MVGGVVVMDERHPWNVEVEPITVKDDGPNEAERTTHPAFGVVQISRVTGGKNTLHGSDFGRHAYISITISEAEEWRSLSNTWHFATKPMLEFEMSEAQFVAMVSSPGVGSGTPITLRYVNGEHRPRIKLVEHTAEKFSRELREDLSDARAKIDEAIKAINEGGNAKQRKLAIEALQRALRSLDDSAPFVAGQFDEHMDAVAERAKVEAHALLMRTIQQAGLSQLKIADQSRKEPPE